MFYSHLIDVNTYFIIIIVFLKEQQRARELAIAHEVKLAVKVSNFETRLTELSNFISVT